MTNTPYWACSVYVCVSVRERQRKRGGGWREIKKESEQMENFDGQKKEREKLNMSQSTVKKSTLMIHLVDHE